MAAGRGRSGRDASTGPSAGDPASVPAAPALIDPPAPATIEPPGPDPQRDGPRTRWFNINRPLAVGFFLTIGGLIAFALGTAVTSLATIWIYIAFALFAALGLDPIVRRLESAGVRRSWGIVIVSLGFLVVIGGVLWLIVPTVVSQVGQFARDIPKTITDFQNTDLYHWVRDQFGDQVPNLLTELQNFITNPSNLATIGGGIVQVGVGIATTVSGIIIVIVLSLYFLATLPQIKRAFYRLVPAHNRTFVSGITDEITESVGGYLQGMVVLAFANSIVAGILHLALGLPFPLLMAVLAFCITLIPLVGTVAYWVIASVLALFSSPLSALIFAVCYLVYMQIEAYLLTPRVMNKAISVPGSLVVIGALVGGTLLGLLGALVAIPVTASILLIIKRVVIPKQDAKTA